MAIPQLPSIAAYNRHINLSLPLREDFDLRDFEENMAFVPLRTRPFRISFFQLALLETGEGRVNSDGSNYDLDNCTLFFNLPGQVIYWDIDPNWRGLYCSVGEEFYTEQLIDRPRLADYPFFAHHHAGIRLTREEAMEISGQLRRMLKVYRENDEYASLILKAEFCALLAHCLKYYHRAETDIITRGDHSLTGRFRRAVNHNISGLALALEERLKKPADYAAELFVSPGHLSQTVSAALGMPPSEYINRQVIQEGAKLLARTDLTVSQLASQLGFSSVAYFSRLFSRYQHKSPTAFRKDC